MPQEALIVIGDIVREAEDLSEALYNARSKFVTEALGLCGVILRRVSFIQLTFAKGGFKL